ncbi:MAG TPA: response regulator transcription factor [Gammaproteobacteria bacterium]|nr:response regulator transcription factor [Gammaproteobacteria bacterium]
MIFITLIEDNPVSADLLKEYLSGEELKITSHYETAEEALAQIPLLPLSDLVLMDIGLPGLSGIEATRQLKQRFPDLEIVMMTTFEDSHSVVAAIKAGASGYLLKASSQQQIRDALLEVKRGGSYLSGRIARKVLDEFRHGFTLSESQKVTGIDVLTVREQEILNKLVAGATYKAIATELSISVHTVNNHIRHIYEKMHVGSRAEAVAKAMGVS